MKITHRDIAHGWSRVKATVGHAWSTGKHVLHTADRYMDIAHRVLSVASPMLSQGALEKSQNALGTIGQVRNQLERAKVRTEGTYGNLSRTVPELF